MARSLVTTVHVADDKGVYHVFGPGDDVPAWASKQIENPKAWGEEQDEKPARRRATSDK